MMTELTLNQQSRATRWGLSTFGVVATLLVWHLVSDTFNIFGSLALPTPTNVVQVTIEFAPVLFENFLITLRRAAVGYVGAAILALSLAVALTANERLRQTFLPLALAANTVPRVSIAPLIVFYLGDFRPYALIAGWIAFFPMLINAMEGFGDLDEELEDLLDAIDATIVQEYRLIRIPNALPFIFDGLKVGVTLAIVGAIVGEFVAAEAGVGFIALFAMRNYDMALVFSVVAVMALVALTIFLLLYKLQDRLIHWREAALFPE